ncbi:hypothetical protein ACEWPM_007365 [Roseovarius sp. S4756]
MKMTDAHYQARKGIIVSTLEKSPLSNVETKAKYEGLNETRFGWDEGL